MKWISNLAIDRAKFALCLALLIVAASVLISLLSGFEILSEFGAVVDAAGVMMLSVVTNVYMKKMHIHTNNTGNPLYRL